MYSLKIAGSEKHTAGLPNPDLDEAQVTMTQQASVTQMIGTGSSKSNVGLPNPG